MDKKTTPAVAVLVAALVGMAYTHIKDVGMKFDEHVYYMAYLFCANIVAAIAVASFAVATRLFGTLAWLRRTLRAAIGLALSTIAGFMWSRTVGFPQMSDHIGEWDSLGITSLICEGIVTLVSAGLLARLRRSEVGATSGRRRRRAFATAIGAVLAVALSVAAVAAVASPADTGMSGMHYGNMAEYPDLAHASHANVARVRRLHRATNANARRFDTPAKARRLGYRPNAAQQRLYACPKLLHFRKHGGRFWGRLLDPAAPQALVFWCDSAGRFTLVAAMYRAPADPLPPTFGNLLGWHRHAQRGTWMTHFWLTRRTAASVATCAPFNALHNSVGITYENYFQAKPGPDSPCSDSSTMPGM